MPVDNGSLRINFESYPVRYFMRNEEPSKKNAYKHAPIKDFSKGNYEYII